jgi:hypothetical protein
MRFCASWHGPTDGKEQDETQTGAEIDSEASRSTSGITLNSVGASTDSQAAMDQSINTLALVCRIMFAVAVGPSRGTTPENGRSQ